MEHEAVMLFLIMVIALATGFLFIVIPYAYQAIVYVFKKFPLKRSKCWHKRQQHSAEETYSFEVAPLFNSKFKNWNYLRDYIDHPENRSMYVVEFNECKQITNITKNEGNRRAS